MSIVGRDQGRFFEGAGGISCRCGACLLSFLCKFFFGHHREVGSICFAITDDSWIEHITLQEVLGLVIARDSLVFCNLLSCL